MMVVEVCQIDKWKNASCEAVVCNTPLSTA